MDGMHQCAFLAANAALHLLLPVRDCDGSVGDPRRGMASQGTS